MIMCTYIYLKKTNEDQCFYTWLINLFKYIYITSNGTDVSLFKQFK